MLGYSEEISIITKTEIEKTDYILHQDDVDKIIDSVKDKMFQLCFAKWSKNY